MVGELFSKELKKKPSLESSSPEALVVRGRSKEKEEKSIGTSLSKSKGRKRKNKMMIL